ncbi:MAG: chorismate-binding protein, partial [Gemmatimonadales bacterium]
MSRLSSSGYGIVPNRAAFRVLARDADIVPVYREIPFDVETAVRCFAKLARPPFGFLLESVVGGEKWARYSFLGTGALGAWRVRDGRQETWTPGRGWSSAGAVADPLQGLLAAMPGGRVASLPSLPRFWGGAVGFFGYDTVRFFERLPSGPPRGLDVPDALMLFTDVVLAVDKLVDRALVIAPALLGEKSPDDAYDDAIARIDSTLAALRSQTGVGHLAIDLAASDVAWSSTYEQAEFERDVERIRDYIRAGDAFQVVLSQRLTTELRTDPFTVYRALRMMNPSPYLFFLDLDGVRLIGSSPEVMLR